MFIGEVSKKTNIPVKTIRYYEDFGLLQSPKRSVSKYRIYNEKDVEKFLFIKKSKDLGLTLAEIKKIIKRSSQGVKATCCLVHEVFEWKINECEQKIKALKETKHRLSERLRHWITAKEAKNLKFTICPQIDKPSTLISKTKANRRNTAKKLVKIKNKKTLNMGVIKERNSI